VRDRGGELAAERIRFTSAILPCWARHTTSLDALLPLLYLRGVSKGDFQEALGGHRQLVGRETRIGRAGPQTGMMMQAMRPS
jgi:hypothetical protein